MGGEVTCECTPRAMPYRQLRLCSSLQGERNPLPLVDGVYTLGRAASISGAQPKLGVACSLVGPLGVAGDQGESRFCQVCGQKCRSSSELRRHLMTHTGERPYRCPHCPYSSTLKTNVKRHMICLHKSDQPVICASEGNHKHRILPV